MASGITLYSPFHRLRRLDDAVGARHETNRRGRFEDANFMPRFAPIIHKWMAGSLLLVALTGCTGHETRAYEPSAAVRATDAAHIVVLMSDPSRAFTKLGAVSVKKYKPGFSDPSVMDAEEELQKAGAELGADAVVVKNSRNDGTRVIYVDAEAIRYTAP